MTEWTSDELTKIGTADELRIASLRREGTLRNPVTVWVVRHGDDLYVRSVNERTVAWFRGTQARHEGHIRLAASRRTSPSWTPSTPSTTHSMPRTAPSTATWQRREAAPWSEADLLSDLIVRSAGMVECGQDIGAAGISLCRHPSLMREKVRTLPS
jgi:hypothetical protein